MVAPGNLLSFLVHQPRQRRGLAPQELGTALSSRVGLLSATLLRLPPSAKTRLHLNHGFPHLRSIFSFVPLLLFCRPSLLLWRPSNPLHLDPKAGAATTMAGGKGDANVFTQLLGAEGVDRIVNEGRSEALEEAEKAATYKSKMEKFRWTRI